MAWDEQSPLNLLTSISLHLACGPLKLLLDNGKGTKNVRTYLRIHLAGLGTKRPWKPLSGNPPHPLPLNSLKLNKAETLSVSWSVGAVSCCRESLVCAYILPLIPASKYNSVMAVIT